MRTSADLNPMTRSCGRITVLASAVAALLAGWTPVAAQSSAAPRCTPGQVVRVPELIEGSGAAAGRGGRIWAHNDSGQGGLIALDERGSVTARVALPGIRIDDWEALAAGPCPSGTCLFAGDIGDNDGERKQITIYRFPEPDASASVKTADAFRLSYPDEPQDAETLLVTPKGDIYIVTKGDTAAIGLYRVPRDAKPGTSIKLERIGKPRGSGPVSADDRITDGAVSPDGAWVVLRTTSALSFHRAADLFSGNWSERGRVDLGSLKEPQGEGVTFGDASTVYLVGEGGGKKQPGTFARLTCTF